MPLTDTTTKQAKPAAKPYKLSDEKGMFLLINPNGSKLWRLKYRIKGKEKLLALGSYPDISLKQARIYRDEARQLIANGTDPGELRKTEKITLSTAKQDEEAAKELERMVQAGEALPGSFRAVALEWISTRLADITAAAVLAVLRRIEAHGMLETMRKVKQHIGGVMRYAILTERATSDPTPALGAH